MGPLPEAVELAGYQGVAQKTAPNEIQRADFFEPVEDLKKRFSKLINCSDHERIAIIPSVSYGMANAVRNVKASPGQNIVLVEEIFPSNYYPWKRLADEAGCELRIVPAPVGTAGRGAFWNEKLLEAIDGKTAAAALPHAHWADGTLFDLEAIRQKTREVGALLVIDGTQSVGAYPFDLEKIQPDALICAGYKWLLGPYGTGLAYYGEQFDGGIPIEENWINRLNSEHFEALVNYQPAYKPKAHRYCVGESSQFIAVPMLLASIGLLLEWGVENIRDYCREISGIALEELKRMGCRVEDESWRCGHLFGIRFPEGVDLQQLSKEVAARKVFVSFRGNAMRVSPHVYNDGADLAKLTEAISAVVSPAKVVSFARTS
jgi:selenocysteine lyase/cysteine desulfurase